MKKTSITVLLIFLIFLIMPATVGARPDAKDSPFLSNPPQTFTVTGYKVKEPETHHPYHAFQQSVSWTFTDDEEVHKQFIYSIPEGTEGGPSEHTIDIYLTYDRDLVNSSSTLFFITGTYSHKIEDSRMTIVHNGFLKGELLPLLPEERGFVSDYEKANALVFQMTPFGIIWDWKLIYEIEGEVYEESASDTAAPEPTDTESPSVETSSTPDPYFPGTGGGTDHPDYENRDYPGYENPEYPDYGYNGYGCSKLLPDPGPPLSIGFGVALVIICVYILNKATGTFIYNDVTYNNYFDPDCPYILKGTKGNPLKIIPGLYNKLKEMLVNDGRDYAAGRRAGSDITDESPDTD